MVSFHAEYRFRIVSSSRVQFLALLSRAEKGPKYGQGKCRWKIDGKEIGHL